MVSLQILGFCSFACYFVMCWMFYGFPANLGFSVAFVRYVLDVYGFLQILGFFVACCSLCVGCLWFPCKF
jgi:hypothetical protein